MDNTHEVAQGVDPAARIVYVDNDPLVLTHAQALLTGTPEGRCNDVQADLRDPERILTEAAKSLDFDEPVAVMLLGILRFIPDFDEVHGIVARLVGAVPSGSFLAVTHATMGPALADEAALRANAEAREGWDERAATPLHPRGPGVERHLDGRGSGPIGSGVRKAHSGSQGPPRSGSASKCSSAPRRVAVKAVSSAVRRSASSRRAAAWCSGAGTTRSSKSPRSWPTTRT